MTLREYVASNRHWTADAELRSRAVKTRLGNLLDADTPPLWIQALATFVLDRPWRYWDHTTVGTALDLLDRDPIRTADALQEWHTHLNVGFDALFLESAGALSDEHAQTFSVRQIVRLGTVFHPEYLRIAEHVFGNLVSAFWAVQRKGPVRAKFDLTRAVGELRRNGWNSLVNGFDDRIRNAIAHGEVAFRGIEIRYGPPIANYQQAPSSFLTYFDELIRTSNALALAVLLFWSRHHLLLKERGTVLPIRPLGFIAAASMDSHFITFEGAYESELNLTGRQFHIGLRTRIPKREFVLMTVATVAYHLIEFGGVNYDRFNFEINYGRELPGLVIVDVTVLRKLLEEDPPAERVREVWSDPLLWFDESLWRTRVRSWWAIFRSRLALGKEEFRLEMVRRGQAQDHRGYWIRGFEDKSIGGIRRAEIHVVLRHPDDALDKGRLREIARLAIRDAKRHWVKRRIGGLGSERGWRTRPRQIGVRIYREDGPVRWLGRDGWMGGNLVALAERNPVVNWRYNHVFVPDPDEIWRGIRMQYGMAKRFRELLEGNADSVTNEAID